MTFFEFRAMLIFYFMKLLRIKFKQLRESYSYNPYSKSEIKEFYWWKNEKSI